MEAVMTAEIETEVELIHIFVEIDRKTRKKLEFPTSEVTGRQIKEQAGVPLENDLARRQGQKLDLVTNDQPITIKNGEHFVVFPPGTIS
jgi:hypothetical protein